MARTFTEQLEAYNEALRVAEKEEILKGKGRWTSAAKAKAWKREMLDVIKEQANKEFNALQDYQKGKTAEPRIYGTTVNGLRVSESLFYFEFPEIFESDISNLDDCLGELTHIDKAWINNTRKLIQQYHAVITGELEQQHSVA
jgi:hypothetical protein